LSSISGVESWHYLVKVCREHGLGIKEHVAFLKIAGLVMAGCKGAYDKNMD